MGLQVDQNGPSTKALKSLIYQCKNDKALADEAHIQLVINTNKPMGTKNDYIPRIIPLKGSRFYKPSELRILLIVKDPSTIYRKALLADEATANLFADIISVKNLRAKFKGSRLSKLFKSFDMVVADYRVQHLLSHILGPTFYKSNKKIPFILQMSKQVKQPHKKMVEECDTKYIKAQVKSICRHTWYLPNKDNCLTVRVGRVGVHSVEEIQKNIDDVIAFVTDSNARPQGGCIRGGIKSLFVKTSNSTSLPIYSAPASSPTRELEAEPTL